MTTTAGTAASVADEWRASLFSIVTFSWLTPLIKLGYSRPLVHGDLGSLMKRDRIEPLLNKFELKFMEIANDNKYKKEKVLSVSLRNVFYKRMIYGMLKLWITTFSPGLTVNILFPYI